MEGEKDAFAEGETEENYSDSDGAAAVDKVRHISSLGSVFALDPNALTLSLDGEVFKTAMRAINYANVKAPKVKHEQHTYVRVSRNEIRVQTSRVGSLCSFAFPLKQGPQDDVSDGCLAFELEPHVVPLIAGMANQSHPVTVQYSRANSTLSLKVANRQLDQWHRSRNVTVTEIELEATAVDADRIFDVSNLEDANSFVKIDSPALGAALAFADSLNRRIEGTNKYRNLTVSEGFVFGGSARAMAWTSDPTLAAFRFDVAHDHAKDVCRLLSRQHSQSKGRHYKDQLVIIDGPFMCVCDTAIASTVPPAIAETFNQAILMDRTSLARGCLLMTALDQGVATEQNERDHAAFFAVDPGVGGGAFLELRFRSSSARNDHQQYFARLPCESRSPAQNAQPWTFSVNAFDLLKVLDRMKGASVEIGIVPRGIKIQDILPGRPQAAAVFAEQDRDLSSMASRHPGWKSKV